MWLSGDDTELSKHVAVWTVQVNTVVILTVRLLVVIQGTIWQYQSLMSLHSSQYPLERRSRAAKGASNLLLLTEQTAADLDSCLRWGKPTVLCLSAVTDTIHILIYNDVSVKHNKTLLSNVYWTVHRCNSWRMKDQLDVTCFFISLLMCSTCFGH